MEGAIILHETIHEIHMKKTRWIDVEKTYDKVK